MRGKTEDLKEEVYRQVFRLEESKPGCEMSLALALLRAWAACGLKRDLSGPEGTRCAILSRSTIPASTSAFVGTDPAYWAEL
jgi:predicted small lipoprotein YifL